MRLVSVTRILNEDDIVEAFVRHHEALTLAMRHAEHLARQHGALLDRSAEARHLVATWNAERRFLF